MNVEKEQRSSLFGSATLFAGGATTSINGLTFEPDETKGYLECSFSHSWPVITYYGECLAPATVQRSFQSVRHQPVNREHRMRIHDPDRRQPDEVIGCVVEAECGIHGGAPLPESVDAAPGIRAVAAIFKQANGVDRILGQHQTGRSTMTVSMEVMYVPQESGFILRGEDIQESEQQWTPLPWKRLGLVYVPAAQADEALMRARDWNRNRMRDRRPDNKGFYGIVERGGKRREAYWMMGGIDGRVHYSGLAVVRAGAEPTAQITQMLAHVPEADYVSSLLEQLGTAVDRYIRMG